MAAKAIAGTVSETKGGFVVSDLVGTETINASVLAGEVAIVIDSAVPLHSIDSVLERLRDALREQVSKLS